MGWIKKNPGKATGLVVGAITLSTLYVASGAGLDSLGFALTGSLVTSTVTGGFAGGTKKIADQLSENYQAELAIQKAKLQASSFITRTNAIEVFARKLESVFENTEENEDMRKIFEELEKVRQASELQLAGLLEVVKALQTTDFEKLPEAVSNYGLLDPESLYIKRLFEYEKMRATIELLLPALNEVVVPNVVENVGYTPALEVSKQKNKSVKRKAEDEHEGKKLQRIEENPETDIVVPRTDAPFSFDATYYS